MFLTPSVISARNDTYLTNHQQVVLFDLNGINNKYFMGTPSVCKAGQAFVRRGFDFIRIVMYGWQHDIPLF